VGKLASDVAAGLTVSVGISTRCKQMVSKNYSRSIPLLGLRRDEAQGLKAVQRHSVMLTADQARPLQLLACEAALGTRRRCAVA
jgi:hypothetical protein